MKTWLIQDKASPHTGKDILGVFRKANEKQWNRSRVDVNADNLVKMKCKSGQQL